MKFHACIALCGVCLVPSDKKYFEGKKKNPILENRGKKNPQIPVWKYTVRNTAIFCTSRHLNKSFEGTKKNGV